jgi:hypothetical protein
MGEREGKMSEVMRRGKEGEGIKGLKENAQEEG